MERTMTLLVRTDDGGLVNLAYVVRMFTEGNGTKLQMAHGGDVMSPLSLTEIVAAHSQIFVVSQ